MQEGLVFKQFFGAAMQQADMGIDALDDFALKLQHQTQHAMGGRMLRAEIERECAEILFGHFYCSAFSSPGRMYSAPSQGLRKSKLRNSCVSFTGS